MFICLTSEGPCQEIYSPPSPFLGRKFCSPRSDTLFNCLWRFILPGHFGILLISRFYARNESFFMRANVTTDNDKKECHGWTVTNIVHWSRIIKYIYPILVWFKRDCLIIVLIHFPFTNYLPVQRFTLIVGKLSLLFFKSLAMENFWSFRVFVWMNSVEDKQRYKK